jgi:hypothetical protein
MDYESGSGVNQLPSDSSKPLNTLDCSMCLPESIRVTRDQARYLFRYLFFDEQYRLAGDMRGSVTYSLTWAQRLNRVFNIDVEKCHACGGAAKVIACIEDPLVIRKILTHLEKKAQAIAAPRLIPNSRAPPQAGLFAYQKENLPVYPYVAELRKSDRVSIGLEAGIGRKKAKEWKDFGSAR